jgi:hypothetical protein
MTIESWEKVVSNVGITGGAIPNIKTVEAVPKLQFLEQLP